MSVPSSAGGRGAVDTQARAVTAAAVRAPRGGGCTLAAGGVRRGNSTQQEWWRRRRRHRRCARGGGCVRGWRAMGCACTVAAPPPPPTVRGRRGTQPRGRRAGLPLSMGASRRRVARVGLDAGGRPGAGGNVRPFPRLRPVLDRPRVRHGGGPRHGSPLRVPQWVQHRDDQRARRLLGEDARPKVLVYMGAQTRQGTVGPLPRPRRWVGQTPPRRRFLTCQTQCSAEP